MMLESLRTEVLEANLDLVRRGLVLYTFGNVSGMDRELELVVIKPSGVDYDRLRPEDMVVTDLNGKIVEGDLKPSSDLDTHTLLYREFRSIGAVVQTHSQYASSFAQAGLPIPVLGTTHADYFYGPVPCTDPLSDAACGDQYVHETGAAIAHHFHKHSIDPNAVPACLVAGHAPFVWGLDVYRATHHAVILEAIAKMAYNTLTLAPNHPGISQALLDRHYLRKHGPKATYGQ